MEMDSPLGEPQGNTFPASKKIDCWRRLRNGCGWRIRRWQWGRSKKYLL